MQQLIDAQNSTIASLLQELEQLRVVAIPNLSYATLQAAVEEKTAALAAQVKHLQGELARSVEASLSRRLPAKLEELRSNILEAAAQSLATPLSTLKEELLSEIFPRQKLLTEKCHSLACAETAQLRTDLETQIQALLAKIMIVAPPEARHDWNNRRQASQLRNAPTGSRRARVISSRWETWFDPTASPRRLSTTWWVAFAASLARRSRWSSLVWAALS